MMSDWSKNFAGLTPEFELMFERFEMLGSLAYLERNDKAIVQEILADNARDDWAPMPVGRAGWRRFGADKLIAEIQLEPVKSALIRAGFARGDPEFIDLFIQNFRRIARRIGW